MKLSAADIEQIKREHPVPRVVESWGYALRRQMQGQFPFSGPCPLHSPDPKAADSTSFACDDAAWACATCAKGGDVIALVAYREGLDPRADFRQAVELLTGGVTPRLSAEERAALEDAAAEEKAQKAAEANEFRDRERAKAYDLYYKYGIVLRHPAAQIARDYLALRGLDWRGLRLRFNPAARYYVADRPKPRLIHTGPALLGLIQREGRFHGCHSTFLDPSLCDPSRTALDDGSRSNRKGKARLTDPKTGAVLDAKKVRGSMRGGHIDLTGVEAPHTLVLGEGIEKTIAVRDAYAAAGRVDGVAFWSAMNLGNLGGKASGNLTHPSARGDGNRPLRPAGPAPDLDAPAIVIPETVTRVVLLGDSTSDRFTTECVLARAAARYAHGREQKGEARLPLEVVVAWGPEGKDFDDLLREAA